jgi:MoaA/NifB/PqqE/SkfB family radical SAM enzyme
MINKKEKIIDMSSFKSAEIDIPEKMITNRKALKQLAKRELKPIHIQLFPTNKCNLKCSFCSCEDRDKSKELDIEEIKKFYNNYIDTIQSTTISGGGEPLMYKKFNELIKHLISINTKIGLVSNGLLFNRYSESIFKNFTWCRISLSEASLDNGVFDIIKKYIKKVKIDWAFSFVAGNDIKKDVETIKLFYNEFEKDITHFRLVGDINNPDHRVTFIEEQLSAIGDFDKIIYQSRTDFKHGAKKCYLALVKPVIAADGNIYPCCGVQYAIKNSNKDLNNKLKMGHISDTKIMFNRKYFDTYGICDKCYYDSYNSFINIFHNKDMKHQEFI